MEQIEQISQATAKLCGTIHGNFLEVGFDSKGLIGDSEFRMTIKNMSLLLAKYVTSPLNIDDRVIANTEKAFGEWLDTISAVAPAHPVVARAGAPSPAASEDAKHYALLLASEQGVSFSQETLDHVGANPAVIDLISDRTPKNQADILSSPWLKKISDWVEKYGQLATHALMFLVPAHF